MKTKVSKLVAATAALVLAVFSPVEAQSPKVTSPVAVKPTLPPITPSRVIGNGLYFAAGGCESRGQHFDVAIPDAARLDVGHQSIIPGIEFQETTHVGSAGARNVVFNGSTLSFDLYAEGKGTKQSIPFVGEKCIGAEGASIGYKIVAFYR